LNNYPENNLITKNDRMKTLIIASSFVFAGFMSYGWMNSGNQGLNAGNHVYSSSQTDTVPRSKDSMNTKNKKWGNDSLHRRDTSWPKKDSARQ
jgi:hypothetical protein